MKFMRKLETKAKVILYSKLLLTYTYPDSFTSFETVLDSVKILVLAHNNS